MKWPWKSFLDEYGIWGPVLALALVGLLCLFSVSSGKGLPLVKTVFFRQIFWILLGLCVLSLASLIPENLLYQGAYAAYALSLVLLVVVLLLPGGNVHRWIGFRGIRFQPSEAAKACTLLAMARCLAGAENGRFSPLRAAVALGIACIPAALIAREPDLGTALTFPVLFAGMAVRAGIAAKTALVLFIPAAALLAIFAPLAAWIFLLLLILILMVTKQRGWITAGMAAVCSAVLWLAPFFWSGLEPYQQQRIEIFLGLKSDPYGAAYQVIQSRVAIGSGGILGKGFMRGTQTQLRFLPEQHTDFIFSVCGEEFGFLGVVFVLGLFFVLLAKSLAVTRTARRPFSNLVAMGVFTVIFFQMCINVGMTTGLLPVTGLPLPFVSYGGSSMILFMFLTGVLMGISRRRYEYGK